MQRRFLSFGVICPLVPFVLLLNEFALPALYRHGMLKGRA